MKTLSKNIFWAVITLILITLLFTNLLQGNKTIKSISLNELAEMINQGEVTKIVASGNDLTINLKNGKIAETKKESEVGLSETLKNLGVDSAAMRQVTLDIKDGSGFKFWLGILLPTLLPLIIIIGIFWFIMKQAKSGASQVFSFGRSNIKLSTSLKDKVTFKDVAGLKEAKEELIEIVDFLKNPKKYLDLGAKIPRGVLLMGSPGTGKTLLARAVAGEAGVPFFHMSASEFVEMFVGVGASVTGDTPVLIRTGRDGAKLVPISEFVDASYKEGESDVLKLVDGVEALGYAPLENKFWGTCSKEKSFFGSSKWSPIKGVYRHKADKIYKIHFRGGIIKTTGNHSIFVRSGNMIISKKASELKAGDILVNLPFKVRSHFIPGIGTTHRVKAHDFSKEEANKEIGIDLFGSEYEEQMNKYEFVMANRGTLAQSRIGALVGMSQSGVKDWQVGNHKPRIFHSNLNLAGAPKKLFVTRELLRLLGYYTAEGRTAEYYTQFVFGLHEKEFHTDCIALIKDIFKLEPQTRPIPESNSFRINISSPFVARFFKGQCGNGSHNKHIPQILWDLQKDHFLAFLQGYSRGDGYTTKDGKLSMSSASKQLIMELAWLSAMHGIQVGIREMVLPAGRIINAKPLPETRSWNLIIGKTAHPFKAPESPPNQFKKPIIQKIEEEPYDGYVYDLCGCENEAFFGGDKPVLLHNSRVRDSFQTAKKAAPSIIFIDEIDAVGRQRGAGIGGGHDEREQTLNQILVEMDGFDRDTKTIVIAATNRPDILDPALLRPGRFDRSIILDMPDIKDREAILKIHSKGKPLEKDIDLRKVAVRTPGFSGADLANLINEAAILAARRSRKIIIQQDLFDSVEKVLLGPERKSRAITDKEKRITAYHEAGHALVTASLKNADPVHKVSIVSRGRAGGYTLKLPSDDMRLRTKSQFLNDLAIMMGGYTAEKLVFRDISTGASNDLTEASKLSKALVTKFGMSDLGPITFGKSEEMVFLGKEIAVEKDYSESVAAKIDKEIQKLISLAFNTAKKIIESRRKVLDVLAETLIKQETLEQDEFYNVLKPFKLKPIVISV